MFINPRRQKYLKRKLVVFILLLGILGCSTFFLNTFFASREPLYISPVGGAKVNQQQVEKILKENKILFTKVTLLDNSCLIDIQNNGQVRISQDKDIVQQIDSLQKILLELTIVGKPFKSIDLRFSQPIIIYE